MSEKEARVDESSRRINSLTSIAQGAGLYIFAYVFARGAGFVINVLLARLLQTTQYGIYTYANALVSILTRVAELGTGPALLRHLPVSDDDEKPGIATLAYATVIVTGLIIVGLTQALTPTISSLTIDQKSFITAFRIFALWIPLHALTNVTVNIFRALEQPKYQLGISEVLLPITKLCGVGAAVYLGLNLTGVITTLVIASAVTLVASLALLVLNTAITPQTKVNQEDINSFYSHALPLSISQLGTLIYRRVDILMVGYFLAASSVGIYNIAILLTQFVTFPLAAIGQIFPAIASKSYQEDDHQRLRDIYATVTRWSFTGATLIAISVVVFRFELLSLFGEEFIAGHLVIVVFVVGQLLNGITGPSNYLLMMTDNQYVVLGNKLVFSTINVILNVYLIPQYGIVGAALATGIVIGSQAIVELIELWMLEDLVPYGSTFVKPLLATGTATVVVAGIQPLVDGIVGVIIGSAVGALVALGVLYTLGLETEDKQVFQEFIQR